MSVMVSQITGVSILYSTFVHVQIKENIKAPLHWPLWGGNSPVTEKNDNVLDMELSSAFLWLKLIQVTLKFVLKSSTDNKAALDSGKDLMLNRWHYLN